MNTDAIKKIAGEGTYKKGLKIMQNNDFLSFDVRNSNAGARVSAKVQGTRKYQVSLGFQNDELKHHSCNCPAAEYQDICKHAVAVCLEYLDQLNSNEGPAGVVTTAGSDSEKIQPPKLTPKQQELENIRQWLGQLPQELLAERLFKLAKKDVDLRNELATSATLALSANNAQALNKYITKALPKRSNLWEYRKVSQYFSKAVTVLGPVIEHLDTVAAENAMGWCVKALERLEKVQETIDDSGGFRYELEDQLAQACAKQYARREWPDSQRYEWLLQYQYQFTPLSENLMRFVVDQPSREALIEWLDTEFNSIEVPADFRQRQSNLRLEQLQSLLYGVAGNDLANERYLILLEKTARDPGDCLRLAEGWLECGDEFKAEDLLLRARQLDPDHYDQQRIEGLQQRIDLLGGKGQQVWESLWEEFLKLPDYQEWQALWDLQQSYSNITPPENWMAEAEQCLLKEADNTEVEPGQRFWYDTSSEDMARFYMATEQYDSALKWVDHHTLSASLLLAITARAEIVQINPDTTLRLAHEAFEYVLRQARNSAYQEALGHLKEIRLNWLPKHEEHFQMLIRRLESGHRRRPNFYGPLKAQYGEWF